METMAGIMLSQARMMGTIFALALVLTTILASLLAGTILRPIREIELATNQIASGNLNVQVPVKGSDELSSLGRAINSMSEQLEKTDSFKNEIITNVSHSLKTPIAAIRTYAELLNETVLTEEQRDEFVRIIEGRARTLEELVKQMIMLSKLQTGNESVKLERVNLEELCLQSMDGVRALAEKKGLAIEVDARLTQRYALSDREKLATVLENLLSNAVNHSHSGGSVSLSVAESDGGFRVEIADEGEGIHPDDIPYIWDRFYKSQKSYLNRDNGSGIGMHIVANIFELLGYKYGLDSTYGVGTVVYFLIPSHDAIV